MGRGLELHPVTVLLALAFWGLLWGIVGMVLAMPIVASLRIVLSRFSTTRPLANLLAGHLPGSEADSPATEDECISDGFAFRQHDFVHGSVPITVCRDSNRSAVRCNDCFEKTGGGPSGGGRTAGNSHEQLHR